MKRTITSALIATALLAAAPSALPQTRELGGTGELLDGVAALVNEGVVLRSELNQRIAIVMDNLRAAQAQAPPGQRRPLPPLSVLEEQVLEQLILNQIQLQRAERFGITVGDDVLNQAMAGVAQSNGMTLEQMPAALAAEGIDYAMYRQETRDQMILEQLRQREVITNIVVAPREMELCLARSTSSAAQEFDYNISHILIGVASTASGEEIDQAQARVDEVYQRLQDGDSFAELALTYSDAQTALEGGSLGWRKGAQLPTLFANTVIAMSAGDHSEPIQSGSGFHIVRLNEVRGAQPVMVDQLRIRHILVEPTEVMDDSAAEQRLRVIRAQIVDGDDFGAVAQSVSDDAGSSADGGDMGWTDPGVFVPEFEEVIAGLEIGELSEPFRTRFGWHIAEVLDSRSYDTTEELKQQNCAQQIRASKLEEEQALWLRRLRDEAFVEMRM